MSAYVRRGAVTVLAAGAAVLFAACSDRVSSPSSAPALSRAQADSVSAVITADVENEIDAGTASSGIGFIPGAPSPLLRSGLSGSCVPDVSPQPVTNQDGDLAPDSIRIVFTDCVIGFRRGADTVWGTIDVIDPTPAVTDGSLKLAFTNLARIFVGQDGRYASVTQNGSRLAIRDATDLSQTESGFSTDYVFSDGTRASHTRDWVVAFHADANGAIVRDAPLPSGTLTIDGTSTFIRNGATTFELQVSTPTPLHYDATCTDRPRFSQGKIEIEATRQGTTTMVTIEFTACGQYTVTKS